MTLHDRFVSKVNKSDNGCWDWKASILKNGYGCIRINKKTFLAHRVSWEIFNGEIPKEKTDYHGLCVLHKCDNRKCVNPNHLFLGTNRENICDSMKKGRRKNVLRRRPTGLIYKPLSKEQKDRHGNRKIKEVDRQEIIKLLNGGMRQREIAFIYNVTQSSISKLLHVKKSI